MPRFGFIRTKDEIKFLVLTAMRELPFPVPYDAVVDICTWCDDGFGYFELSEAFDELRASAHLQAQTAEDGSELFSITEKGRQTAEAFASRIPYTVREAASVSALRVVRQLRRNAQIITETREQGPTDFNVHLEMKGVCAIDMNVASKNQASMLEKSFQQHAESIYQDLLASLTREYEQ